MLDFPAASDSEVYDQTIDRYVTTLSYFVSMFITAVMFKPLISRCRRLNVISIISMTISLNMVYIVLYFFPTILVTFTYGPLQAKYNCLMNVAIIASSYPICWFVAASLLFSKLALKQTYFTLFSFTSLTYFLIFIVLGLLSFCFVTIIIITPIVIILESDEYNRFQNDAVISRHTHNLHV